MRIAIIGAGSVGYSMPEAPAERTSGLRGEAMRTASAKDCHNLRGVSGARQRSGGVEKYSSIASRQAPEHGSMARFPRPDSRISAAVFSAQLMQTPARSNPQPVQLQFDLWDVSPRLSLMTPPRWPAARRSPPAAGAAENCLDDG